MDRFSLKRIAGISAGLAAGFFFGFLFSGWVTLRIFSEKYAAWVQAVGAVLALVVAIWLNRMDAEERRQEKEAVARNAALAILPYLQEAHDTLEWALRQLKAGRHPSEIGTNEDGENIELGLLKILTDGLKATFPFAAQAGRAARSTQGALRAIGKAQANLGRMYIDGWGDFEYTPDNVANAAHGMERARIAAFNAIGDLNRLFE